ncbi:MAG: hypothetical protein ACFFB5_07385 [Promethearchaeota archaeon]
MNKIHNCQLHCINIMSEGKIKIHRPIRIRLRLFLRKHLSHSMKQRIKKVINLPSRFFRRSNNPAIPSSNLTIESLKTGDLVRVRSKEEIRATLDRWGALRGCAFMHEMEEYCGTIQRVMKPVLRFVDERDLSVKRSKGIFILEGLICQGTESYGPCDRSCFFFWRGEWLKKIENEDHLQTKDIR